MSIYDAEYAGKFYDAYGMLEWDRLEATPYGRMQAIIHSEFIERYVCRDNRVLDAGCGPGRFTAVAAHIGADVTALDLSEGQLRLAKEKLGDAGLLSQVDAFVPADITDLSMFPNNHFDVVICYGGALSYVCEQRHQAASELVRVVRPEGVLLVSVMSRYGNIANLVRRPTLTVLKDPEEWNVWQVADVGDNPGFPSPGVNMQHPPMHLFTSKELCNLLPDCSALELAGSNVTTYEGSAAIKDVFDDAQAWSTALSLERLMNTKDGLTDSGSHIIMAAQRQR